MRRMLIAAFAVILLGVGIAALVSGDSTGAVKAPLYELPWPGIESGWAIVNCNASGDVICEVHVTGAPADTTYDVAIGGAKPHDGSIIETVICGGLTTNGQGIGNSHIVAPLVSEPVWVRVRLVVPPYDFVDPDNNVVAYATQKIQNVPVP